MVPRPKVNRKSAGAPPAKEPRSSGSSPAWVSLDRLCRAWVTGEQLRTGVKGLLEKYASSQKGRLKTSSYEAACWGALKDCKMFDAARNLQAMVMDLKLPMRGALEGQEIYLGRVSEGAVARAAKTVASGVAEIAQIRAKNAAAAPRQRVIEKPARAPTKPVKASPARAVKRTAPKRQPTRG